MAHVFTTTAELLQLADGNISDIDVSELLEDAPALAAMSAIEASNETSHEWLKKTAAPGTGFRDINDGRENTIATYTKVIQSLKLFDASCSIDMGLLKTKSGDALKVREAKDHLMACFADMEKQIMYGTAQDAAGFTGFSQETEVASLAGSMVVNAGGATAGEHSDVWAVRLGESAVSVVYGGGGRIEIGEEYPTVLDGSTTGIYDAYRTPILFYGGLQVATSLDLGRIANLSNAIGTTLTDDMLSDLYALFPANRKPNAFIMSRRSQKQLQQSRTATNATGAEAPFPTEAHGVQILVSDQVSDVEAVLA